MSDQPIRAEAQRVAAETIRRETRRVRTLAALTIGLWIVAALLVASIAMPLMAKMKHVAIALKQPGPTGQPLSAQEIADLLANVLPGALGVGVVMLGMAMFAGMLASACTVALSLTIRRVTLRQISESLAQISSQMRELKPPATPPATV
jgi:TctA family transporter